jgi:hypothetical protein
MIYYSFCLELIDGSLMEGAAWGIDPSDAFDNLMNCPKRETVVFNASNVEFSEISEFAFPGVWLVAWLEEAEA